MQIHNIPKMIQVAIDKKYQSNKSAKSSKPFQQLMLMWSNGQSCSLAETYQYVLALSAVELNQFITELDEVLNRYENGIY